MMTNEQLQAFLHQSMPATRTLGLRVNECSREKVVLTLPHAGNQNHKNTIFGGSMALAATTSGWALMHLNFPEADGNIVIQQGQTRYLRPALHDLTLITRTTTAANWQTAREALATRGKGKVVLETECYVGDEFVAMFSGRYVVLS